ncbi:MAG: hypothetical protein R2795_11745 [Saprospiraceae bacterium]
MKIKDKNTRKLHSLRQSPTLSEAGFAGWQNFQNCSNGSAAFMLPRRTLTHAA